MPSFDRRNEIAIGNDNYLLVEAGGYRAHLVRRAEMHDQNARPAVDRDTANSSLSLPAGGAQNYDLGALSQAIWQPKTVCGVHWYVMAATDAGPLTNWQEPTYVPDCDRCLRSASRGLVSSAVDHRVALVAAAAARLVEHHGYASVDDIPGDQTEHFRRGARQACRALGMRIATLVDTNGTVHIHSQHLLGDTFVGDGGVTLSGDEFGRACSLGLS